MESRSLASLDAERVDPDPFADVRAAGINISPALARDMVAGKTEKPGGVEPSTWIHDTDQYLLVEIPVGRVRANESGMLYDGTVNADRARCYARRAPELAPPVILVGSRRTRGQLNVLDGGHRVSAARLRGDSTIKALVRLPSKQGM